MDRIYIFVETVCMILLSLMVLVVAWIVFGRYVLNKTPAWGEELSLMLMVWIGLLSAALGLREDSHLRLTIIDFFTPKKFVNFLKVFVVVLIAGFSVLFFWQGIEITKIGMLNTMPGLGIKAAWFYLSAPVAGVLMLLFALERLIRNKHDS
ncbi:MAG: TRAP transporter small permease [Spirochaetaceae bacterium]|nr:TRAP transporter small permease [Spirochaetaceae bacterium]